MMAAGIQPGWLATKSPHFASASGTGFNHSTSTLPDSLATAVLEIASSLSSWNGTGLTSSLRATSSGGAPASWSSAMSASEVARLRQAA